jgi:hypothetical protein
LTAAPENITADHGENDRDPTNIVDIKVWIWFGAERLAFVDIDVVDDEIQWRLFE